MSLPADQSEWPLGLTALIGWIEGNGYRLTGNSRELYHEMGADGPQLTELQLPIAS